MPKQRDQTKEFVENLVSKNENFKNTLLHNICYNCYNRFILCVCERIDNIKDDNYRQQYIQELTQLLNQENYARIIIAAFQWDKTKDGVYYWSYVHYKFKRLNET